MHTSKNKHKFIGIIVFAVFIVFSFSVQAKDIFSMVPQIPHSDVVRTVAHSKRLNLVATAGDDSAVKLWDFYSGQLIKTITNNDIYEVIKSVAFSPTGHIIAVGTDDSMIRLYDIQTGEKIQEFGQPDTSGEQPVTSLAFHPKGNFLISGYWNGEIRLWNVSSGDLEQAFEHGDFVECLNYSSDGKEFISGGWNGVIKLWSPNNKLPQKVFSGHSKPVRACEFSPNNLKIISADGYKQIKIWDKLSGLLIKNLSGKSNLIHKVRFSSDGSKIISGSMDKFIQIWDIKSGLAIETINTTSEIMDVLLTPDQKEIISVSHNGVLSFWNRKNQKLRVASVTLNDFSEIAFTKNNNDLTIINSKNKLRFWDVNQLQLSKLINGPIDSSTKNRFIAEKNIVISNVQVQNKHDLYIWDAVSGILKNKYQDVNLLDISSNGQFGLIQNSTGTLSLFDFNKNKYIWKHPNKVEVLSARVSPLGRYIALGLGTQNTSEVWDLYKNTVYKIPFKELSVSKYAMAFSEDESKFAFQDFSDNPSYKKYYFLKGQKKFPVIKIVNLNNYQEDMEFRGLYMPAIGLNFSANSNYISIFDTYYYNNAFVYDLNKRTINEFNTHQKSPDLFRFNQYNSLAVTASNADRTIKVWNLENKKEIYNIIFDEKGEYLVWTPDGYFDGTSNIRHLVSITNQLKGYAPDQFALKYNRPDIILQRIGNTDQNLINHFKAQYQKRLRKAGLKEEQLSSDLHAPTVEIRSLTQQGKQAKLEFKLIDSLFNLKSYNIFVNDVPLFPGYGKPTSGKSQLLTEMIELSSGENKIELSDFNEKGAESFRALSYAHYDQKITGNLYYIGIGASKFKDSRLNLLYPDKDVKDTENAFKKMKGKFGQVFVKTLLNENVTIANIRQLKDFLKNAKVDDTVILFIAGHGTHSQDADASYFYLTHNTDLNKLKDTAANFELIEDILAGIKPRTKFFLMDTCESGELDDAKENQIFQTATNRGFQARTIRGMKGIMSSTTGLNNTVSRPYLFDTNRFIYNDIFRRTGAVVFSSSRGGEFSYEPMPPYNANENGFFTKAFLQSLKKGVADLNNDNWVTKEELKEYVSKTVATKSQGLQNPTIDRDNLSQKLILPVIE